MVATLFRSQSADFALIKAIIPGMLTGATQQLFEADAKIGRETVAEGAG
jgi:hypothetical protein